MNLTKLTLIVLLGATVALPFTAEAQPRKAPRYEFNANNTRGWSRMSAAERTEHQNRMLAAKTYNECTAVQDEQQKLMVARANDKGMTLGTPKVNACDEMKARGIIK
jgi:hypothetical protein